MGDLMVSICCMAYNAEKYIAQCLDGFLMQKCDFAYEVFVHDDASTDGTVAVIKDYEKRYPEIIHAIYQTENQYSKGVKITDKYIYPYTKGKYIALCEGDDFWTDPLKLQKQVEALEKNHDCHICVHKVKGVYEDLSPFERNYPNFSITTGIIPAKRFIDYNCTNEYIFQTSSYFMRRDDVLEFITENPEFRKASATGDLAHMFYFATKGDIYYIDDEMSCYRQNSTSSKARRSMNGTTERKIQEHFNKQISMMLEYDKYTNGIYHNLCERKINGYLFDKAVRNRDFREVVKIKYRFFLRKYDIKTQIKTYCYAAFPKIMEKYDKYKSDSV